MRISLLCRLLFALAPTVAGAAPVFRPAELAPVAGDPYALTLDGAWLFRAAEGTFAPSNATPEAIDAVAANFELAATNAPAAGWHAVDVPQMLNRVRWWLPGVSPEFEKRDAARVKALPFDAERTAAGWYLHQLVLPAAPAGEPPESCVQFEGVAMLARVYCNGRPVGGHTGMFGAFECRLTPHLRWGATNSLLVHVQRGGPVPGTTVPLNPGFFGGFGRGADARALGIWQPVVVRLAGAPGGRIEDVFFQPRLDGHRLDITLHNPGSNEIRGAIVCTVLDARSGAPLGAKDAADTNEAPDLVTLKPGARLTVQRTAEGLKPRLWTPDTPQLYELSVEWRSADGARLIDRWTHRVGYRTVEVKDAQLLLNGRPYWVRGAAPPPYGWGPNDEDFARASLRTLHDGRTVVTRSFGNPLNRRWLSLADEIGIGLVQEGPRPWALAGAEPPPPAAVVEHWRNELLETVRQHRNHPSVLLYCLAHEGLQGDHENRTKLELFKELAGALRGVDPTRPLFQTAGEPDPLRSADLEDVHAYWGWYEPSSFVNDYSRPRRGLIQTPGRAFLNLECALPLLDAATGGVPADQRALYTAQPWIGEAGVYGRQPALFGTHAAAEARRRVEQMRFHRRSVPTSGLMLSPQPNWFPPAPGRSAAEGRPLPVWAAVRDAFAPILVAWETPQSVFRGGVSVHTRVFVVNDDIAFRDLKQLSLRAEVVDAADRPRHSITQPLGDVDYAGVGTWPLELDIPASAEPATNGPVAAAVRLILSDALDVLSTNRYPILIAPQNWTASGATGLTVVAEGCAEPVLAALAAAGARVMVRDEALAAGVKADVVLAGPGATAVAAAELRAALKPGGRLVLLEQGAAAARACPEVFRDEVQWGPVDEAPVPAGGLRDGARWCSDREFELREIPGRLAGATLVTTRMADRASDATVPLLRFTLGTPAKVLIGFDRRCAQWPDWLRAWRATGESLATGEGRPRLALFERDFPAGPVVLFGSRAPMTTLMYAVIVQAPGSAVVTNVQRAVKGRAATTPVTGEFVEMLGRDEGRPIFDGLDTLDWKWWAQGSDAPAFACTAAHAIDTHNPAVIPLGRYLAPHFPWSGVLRDAYESRLAYPVFAVRRDGGELLVCDLSITAALPHDPRAAKTLVNLVARPLKQ